MKTILLIIAIIVLSATVAWAACRTWTVWLPDGTMQTWMECCTGSHCQVTCVSGC